VREASLTGHAVLRGSSVLAWGVLGWLLAQRMAFEVVEHAHLTDHGYTHHHTHAYAAPVALAAGALALVTLLATLAIGGTARVSSSPGASRAAALVASGVFVVVETWEFAQSGGLHGHASWAVFGAGALLQLGLMPLTLRTEHWCHRRIAVLADRPGRSVECVPPSTTSAIVGRVRAPRVVTSRRSVASRAPPAAHGLWTYLDPNLCCV